MITRCVASLLLLVLSGCAPSGPASTSTTSAGMASLAEKTAFLSQYVTFSRTYHGLDFSIEYRNNGGGLVPGPSDWDIRIVAVVPSEELPAWIPSDAKQVEAPDKDWLNAVPTAQDFSAVNEWYAKGGRTVGLDREKCIVVYRALSN